MSDNFQNLNMKTNNNYIDVNLRNKKFNNEQNQMNKHLYINNMNYYNDNEKKNNEKIGGKNTNNKSESVDFDFENIDLDAYFGSQLRGNSQSVRQTSKKSFKRIKPNKLYISKTNFYIPSSNNTFLSNNNTLNNNNNYNIFTSKNDVMKNLCHGFIDCFFSQKDELENIKSEIQKLQWMFINSHITSTNAGYYMGQMPIINNNNNNVKYVISSENKMSFLSDNKKKNNFSENIIENYSATFGKKKENNDNKVNINDSNVKKLNFNDNNSNDDIINNSNNKNKSKSLSFDNLFSTANKINEKKDNFPEIIKEQDEEYNPSNEKKFSQKNNIIFEQNSQQVDEMENMKNINLKDIQDEEFDSFLNGLKNKKNSLPNNDKKTNIIIPNKNLEIKAKKKNSFEPVSTSQKNLVETDFIAGNKKATYKPNEKTKKLLEEMDKDIQFYDDIDDASKTKSKIKKMFPEKKSIVKKRNYNESIKNSNSKENNNSKIKSSKTSKNDNIQPIYESSDENEEVNIKKKLMKYPAYRINKQVSKDKEVKKENNIKDEIEKNSKKKTSKDIHNNNQHNHNNENEKKEEEFEKKDVIPLKIQNFQ